MVNAILDFTSWLQKFHKIGFVAHGMSLLVDLEIAVSRLPLGNPWTFWWYFGAG